MTAPARIVAERQARHESRMAKAAEVVPQGLYCYGQTGPFQEMTRRDGSVIMAMPTRRCPHWTINGHKRDQESGYCRLMKKGDWMRDGPSLLWDQVKECGINAEPIMHEGMETYVGMFDAFPLPDGKDG